MEQLKKLPLSPEKKITIEDFLRKKRDGLPITMITAYDYPTAIAADRAGLDSILVGDSLGMVVLGYPDTLSVTMEEVIHHAKAVSRGAQRPLLIGDLPFLSYQASISDAVRSAGRLLKEGGMNAVKLEGGREMVPQVKAIVAAGIPVMGHIGLTPQSVNKLGGFKVQGKTAAAAKKILEDAKSLEAAGCFAIVIESIPARLAALICRNIRIPGIGIGASPQCGGQVLVAHDMLGLFDKFTPRFVRRYANLYQDMENAFRLFRKDIEARLFPAQENTYDLPEKEWKAFLALMKRK